MNPPDCDAMKQLLVELNDALRDAWRDGRLPHDVISADLARRLREAAS